MDKIAKYDESEKAYNEAVSIKPTEDAVWMGLRALFEVQGSSKVDQYIDASFKLAQILEEQYVSFP